jgi:hypothetical protein
MDCTCNIFQSNVPQINEHVYNHILTFYVAKCCSYVIKQYVGEILDTCNKIFGLVCIDEGYKDYDWKSRRECSIIRCMYPLSFDDFCISHYELWLDTNVMYIHKHKCIICVNEFNSLQCLGHMLLRRMSCDECEKYALRVIMNFITLRPTIVSTHSIF